MQRLLVELAALPERDRASLHVAVPAEILRRRVHDGGGAESERTLQRGRRERAVDHEVRPGRRERSLPARRGPRPSSAGSTASRPRSASCSAAAPGARSPDPPCRPRSTPFPSAGGTPSPSRACRNRRRRDRARASLRERLQDRRRRRETRGQCERRLPAVERREGFLELLPRRVALADVHESARDLARRARARRSSTDESAVRRRRSPGPSPKRREPRSFRSASRRTLSQAVGFPPRNPRSRPASYLCRCATLAAAAGIKRRSGRGFAERRRSIP